MMATLLDIPIVDKESAGGERVLGVQLRVAGEGWARFILQSAEEMKYSREVAIRLARSMLQAGWSLVPYRWELENGLNSLDPTDLIYSGCYPLSLKKDNRVVMIRPEGKRVSFSIRVSGEFADYLARIPQVLGAALVRGQEQLPVSCSTNNSLGQVIFTGIVLSDLLTSADRFVITA